MDAETMDAVRILIEFANDHANEVYGDGDEYPQYQDSLQQLEEAVRLAEWYLDSD